MLGVWDGLLRGTAAVGAPLVRLQFTEVSALCRKQNVGGSLLITCTWGLPLHILRQGDAMDVCLSHPLVVASFTKQSRSCVSVLNLARQTGCVLGDAHVVRVSMT